MTFINYAELRIVEVSLLLTLPTFVVSGHPLSGCLYPAGK